MLKLTNTILGALASCALVLGGCSSEPETSRLAQLSNGPDLPEACHQCWDDFRDCAGTDVPMEECEQQIIDCIVGCDAPPPPPECTHCAAGYDACVDAAGEGEDAAKDCAAGIRGCLHACERDEPHCEGENGEDPADQLVCWPNEPPHPCDKCELRFDQCVNEGWQHPEGEDESGLVEQCELVLIECKESCDGQEPPHPCQHCEEIHQECEGDPDGTLEGPDGSEVTCEDAAHNCWEQCKPDEEPNPVPDCSFCENIDEQCADEAGNTEGECAELREKCELHCP